MILFTTVPGSEDALQYTGWKDEVFQQRPSVLGESILNPINPILFIIHIRIYFKVNF